MDRDLDAAFAGRGLLRRRELVQAGWSYKRLRRLVRDGHLRLLAPDVLALPGLPAVDEHLRAAAVGVEAVVSGPTAALLHGWEVREAPVDWVLTVPRNRSRVRCDGCRVLRRDLSEEQVLVRDGLRLTAPLRTVLDCCRDLPLDDAVVVGDSALRARAVTLGQLQVALAQMPVSRARPRVERVLALVDPRSGSVLETLCRLVLVRAGLGPEVTQLVVSSRAGGRIGRVDFAWPSRRLVVEVDGYAFHADRGSYRDDRRRSNALARAGWRLLRFSWEDVVAYPEVVCAAVRDLLEESCPCRTA